MDWVEDLHQARVRHGQIRNGLAQKRDWWYVHSADQVDAFNRKKVM